MCSAGTEFCLPKNEETARAQQVNYSQVHSVGMLKKETGPAIHSPTGEIKRELQRCVISIGRQSLRGSPSKIAIAVFPRTVSVVLATGTSANSLDLLMDRHNIPS